MTKPTTGAMFKQLLVDDFRGNSKFGFTKVEESALNEFEQAVREERYPCIGHCLMEQRRRAVLGSYAELEKLGITNALTASEVRTVNACRRDTE